MASIAKEKASLRARLAELMDSWGRKSQKIEHKKTRIASMGKAEGMKPSLFARFRKLLDQIALFEEQERNIISEINAVEKKHRILRQRKKLKGAKPAEPPRFRANDFSKKDERRRNRLWWIIIILLFMIANRRRDKKRAPTALKVG